MPILSSGIGAFSRKNVCGAFFAALLAIASPGLAADGAPDCIGAAALAPSESFRGYAGKNEDFQRFRLDLPAPGIVSVDLLTAAEENLAKIDLSRNGCGGPERRRDLTVLEQSATHLAFAARTAGTWWVRLASEDPDGRLGQYRIVTSFTAARVREESFESATGTRTLVTRSDFYAVDPAGKAEQEIVDPDPGTLTLGGGSSRLLAKVLTAGSAAVQGKAEQEIVDPDPGTLRADAGAVIDHVLFYKGACTPAFRHDDHGDVMTCATALELGRTSGGELGNAWHDDVDVFVLTLTELLTVEVATRGDTDTSVALVDRSGQRLALDDDGGAGRNSRIIATLAPGRYYVRVAGVAGAEGAYELAAEAHRW